MKARLNIELNVDCPKCECFFDLLETELNEEGHVIQEVISTDESWIDAHNNFFRRAKCPECGHKFDVKGVDW